MIRRTRAVYTASLLPGCWVRTENACLGDASIGVARNPLRDGAPPTGFPRATEHDVRPAESTKFFAVLHRAPGQRRSTWSRRVPSSFQRAPLENGGHKLRHSSRPCSPHVKDGWLESSSFSPRGGLDATSPSLALPPRGLCRPVASLVDFRLTRVKRRSLTWCLERQER
jgi:hypothetical protein